MFHVKRGNIAATSPRPASGDCGNVAAAGERQRLGERAYLTARSSARLGEPFFPRFAARAAALVPPGGTNGGGKGALAAGPNDAGGAVLRCWGANRLPLAPAAVAATQRPQRQRRRERSGERRAAVPRAFLEFFLGSFPCTTGHPQQRCARTEPARSPNLRTQKLSSTESFYPVDITRRLVGIVAVSTMQTGMERPCHRVR